MADSLSKFVRRLANLERKVNAGLNQPRLPYSSIDDGSLEFTNEVGETVMIVGRQFDGTQIPAVVQGPPPPEPSKPIVTPSVGMIHVEWDGTFVNGAIVPMDFSRVEVHASTDPAFVPDPEVTLRNTIESPRGGRVVVAGEYGVPLHVRLMARSVSGKFSTASVAETGTPNRVTGPDIEAGSVTTNEIAAGQAWLGTVSVDQLSGGTLDADVVVGRRISSRGPQGAEAGIWAEGFRAYGNIPEGGTDADRPVVVDIPTDGTSSIFSGQVATDTLSVSEGASFSGSSSIDVNSRLVLNGSVKPPRSAPIVSYNYATGITLEVLPNRIIADVTRGANFNWFSCQIAGSGTGTIVEHDPETGAALREFDAGAGDIPHGLIYSPSHDRYYGLVERTAPLLARRVGTGEYRLVTYAADFTRLSSGFPPEMTASGLIYPSCRPAIGWDHTHNLPIVAIEYGASAFGNVTTHTFEINTASPYEAIGVRETIELAGTDAIGDNGYSIGFVGRGDFDYGLGSDRVILKTTNSAIGDASRANFRVFNGAGIAEINSNWPAAFNAPVRGAFWDPIAKVFSHFPTSGTQHFYVGGHENWQGTPILRTWVIYSWYDSYGPTATHPDSVPHESPTSPVAWLDQPKRSELSVTIDRIPTGSRTPEDPDSARVYLTRGAIDPGPPAGGGAGPYARRVIIRAPNVSASLDPYARIGKGPGVAIPFPSAEVPGGIESNDGGSYWYGDNTAKFLRLVVESIQDASPTNPDNLPPLRIGNISGAHLRIDHNEVIAMATPSTTRALILNQTGSVRAPGLIKTGRTPSGTIEANINKAIEVTFPTPFPANGPVPRITVSPSDTGLATRPQAAATAATRSGFTLTVRRENTAPFDVDWIAAATTD